MKKAFVFFLLAALLFSQACLADWEPVTDITLYSGPGTNYSSELGTLKRGSYVQVDALAYDRQGNIWAHFTFAGRNGRLFMAYAPINRLQVPGYNYNYIGFETEPYMDLLVQQNTYVYYGPYKHDVEELLYSRRPGMLYAGDVVSVIEETDDYFLVEYLEDGYNVRGYVPSAALGYGNEPEDSYYYGPADEPYGESYSGYWQDDTPGYSGYSGYPGYSGAAYSYVFRAGTGQNINKYSVYESSHLTNQWNDYKSEYAFDGLESTDWVEGSEGKQLGDYVGCVWRVFDRSIAACGIAIKGGMQYKGYESWNRNQRPRSITVSVNGSNYYFTLADTMAEQTFYFNGDVIRPDANGRLDLRVTVTDVYRKVNEEGDPVGKYEIAINDIDLICTYAR